MNSSRQYFPPDFIWGISVSAFQVEGAHSKDGKGLSVWDEFSQKKGKIKGDHHAEIACDFYHRYEDDLQLLHDMGIKNFRFSLSWSRILPNGTGAINQKGIDYYDRLIDQCLDLGITPWVTIYHWDLPSALEKKGGWTNREILYWFGDYVKICASHFGDRVKNWMVLNEPMSFTGAGHFLGIHAPGRTGLSNFLPALHHATLCQAEGGRILRYLYPHANIGTSISFSPIDPLTQSARDVNAAFKTDALFNRLFLEPLLGLGYPLNDVKVLSRLENYVKANDERLLTFDFDFIGVQTYTREVIKHAWTIPIIWADIVKPSQRNVPYTTMNWEIYPECIYRILKKLSAYSNIPKLIITENGAAFNDELINNQVDDHYRTNYLQSHIMEVAKALKEGVNVGGYFVWSFLDNFEWAEGYGPRFGLVYVDFETQNRVVKESGKWYSNFVRKDV